MTITFQPRDNVRRPVSASSPARPFSIRSSISKLPYYHSETNTPALTFIKASISSVLRSLPGPKKERDVYMVAGRYRSHVTPARCQQTCRYCLSWQKLKNPHELSEGWA